MTELEALVVRPCWLFLEVHTDPETVGLREPSLKGRAQTATAAVREIGCTLIARGSRRIEDHRLTPYPGQIYRGGPILCGVLSGLDHTPWPVPGKGRCPWRDVPFGCCTCARTARIPAATRPPADDNLR